LPLTLPLSLPTALQHLGHIFPPSLINVADNFWEDFVQLREREMGQLSAFSDLVDLRLSRLALGGHPSGLLSQLLKLTCLHVEHRALARRFSAEQFQHLSCLTALREFKVTFKQGYEDFYITIHGLMYDDADFDIVVPASDFAGIQHLSHLTSLKISCPLMQLTAADRRSWAHKLTALEKLSLSHCMVQPDAIAAFTQLRALALWDGAMHFLMDELQLAVSQLTQLTELSFRVGELTEPLPTAAAWAALTASTNLCSLRLSVESSELPRDCVLFRPGTVYPNLRLISLQYQSEGYQLHISEEQLQQLCSCCPSLRHLLYTCPLH
jgi:hypothetical protein